MTLVKIASITPESLVAIKERQAELKQLVKENSYIECTQETYEEAKKRRTALRKGRTNIQTEVKMICSKLAGVSRGVKDAGGGLILIVQKAEDKQQDSVIIYEDEKERIRQEKIKMEQERLDKLKEEITLWMGGMNDRIGQAQTSKDLEKLKNEILLVAVSEEAQRDFPNDIEWAKTQLELKFNNRVAQIELQEQRVEQEKIQREKEELEQKLRETEQAKQELEQKLNGPETKVQPKSIENKEHNPSMEPVQENQEAEVIDAEIIKVWIIRAVPEEDRYCTVKDPNAILAHLKAMEKGNQLYIECNEITIAENEVLKELVGS